MRWYGFLPVVFCCSCLCLQSEPSDTRQISGDAASGDVRSTDLAADGALPDIPSADGAVADILVVDAIASGDAGAPDVSRDLFGFGDAAPSDRVHLPDQLSLDAVTEDAAVAVRWPSRDCSTTLTYRAYPGASEVALEGEFNGWGALPLLLVDLAGNGLFQITLTPANGLTPNERYSYRIVVDGRPSLDRDSLYRAYSGDCLYSAFLMPDCLARPEIVAQPVVTHYDIAQGRGSVQARFSVNTAFDRVPPNEVQISLDGQAVSAGDTVLSTDGEYSVDLDGLEPGRHVLRIWVRDLSGREALPVALPFWIEATAFAWSDAVVYMILLDRFANGDTQNDAPVDIERASDWQGGDLQGALQVLQSGYFENLGVNTIWLSPVNEQTDNAFAGREDSHLYSAYHGYWPTKARSVEPRFGGDAALRAFVDAAHARGIRVLLDLINNQVHQEHDYVAQHPDWFRTGCVCGIDDNCDWSQRPLDCLFAPYLPDINWRVAEAEAQFIDDAVFWIERFGIDGFRVDAVKHVETNSIFNLRAELSRRFEQGGLRIFLNGETAVGQGDSVDYGCGEVYSNGYEWISAYTGGNALDGQFDFPSHHALQGGLLNGTMGFDQVEAVVARRLSEYRPRGLHIGFLGTHDTSRMATRAAESPEHICRWQGEAREGVDCEQMPQPITSSQVFTRLRWIFTLLLTLPHIPFVYYGDEIALVGGEDPDSRRAMIWTGDLQHLAIDPGQHSLSLDQQQLKSWIQALGQVRMVSPAIRHGHRYLVLAEADLYVYAYRSRQPEEVVLVVVNRGEQVVQRQLEYPLAAYPAGGNQFHAVVGSGSAILDSAGLSLSIGAGESSLFRYQ